MRKEGGKEDTIIQNRHHSTDPGKMKKVLREDFINHTEFDSVFVVVVVVVVVVVIVIVVVVVVVRISDPREQRFKPTAK
jgi:cell division protein FtsL